MASYPPVDFCLLIPCYNNENGLIRSLESVRYDAGPYLVLVVDDGSQVPVDVRKIKEVIGRNMDIEVIRLQPNGGITRALNAGLEWIQRNVATEFVARLDCGDLCDPERFIVQINLMRQKPGLVLLASWCHFRDPVTGEQYSYITSTGHKNIIKEMYRRNVFIHPTVMLRTGILEKVGLYPLDYELAEDYAFFWKLMDAGEVAVVDRFLVTCEINKRGLSFANRGKQLLARWKVVNNFGSSLALKIRGFLWLGGLILVPKRLILWLKKKKA